MRNPCFIFVPALLIAACAQEPVAPTSQQISSGPSYAWANNPDNGNPRIVRGADYFGTCWTDPSNGLRACHLVYPLGGGGNPDCGLQEDSDPIEYQDVGTWNPEDPYSSWIHRVVKGPVFITIRDVNQVGTCAGNVLVAEGWGEFRYIDNDTFGSPLGGNTNAWRFRGNSNDLRAPDGTRMVYNGGGNLTYNNKKNELTVHSVTVNLH